MLEKDVKIFGIRKGYILVACILVILIIAFSFAIARASAANQSYLPTTQTPIPTEAPLITPIPTPSGVNTPLPTPVPANTTIRRLEKQGDCVMLGETIDLSGIGWYTGYIAYYGKYRTMTTEGMDASKIYEIQSWQLRKYYIDPLLFKNFPGNWYSHYETVETGNSMLFRVSEGNCTKLNTTNQTNLTSMVIENKTTLVTENFTLPAKTLPGADYIISRNAVSVISVSGSPNSRYWMFGKVPDDKFYDLPIVNGTITFDKNMSNKMSTGEYTILIIRPDGNNIIEEIYDRNTSSISSPFRNIPDISIASATPEMIMALLKQRIRNSLDDTFMEVTFIVEDPYIEVRRLENAKNSDGTNSVVVSGYTNANIGDKITIEFDKGHIDEKLIRANTWTTNAGDGGGISAYRTWYKAFIFDPNEFVTGTHTLTLTTSSGAYVNAPIFIRKELPENYKPPEYIQFIDNNPFIPTPTPITLPKEVVTVVQTVVKTEVVEKEKIVTVDPYPYMIGIIVAMIVIFYALYTIARAYMNARRTRKEKKEQEEQEESYYESENLEGN